MAKEPINAAGFLRQQQEQIFGQVLRRFAHYGQPTSQAIRQALLQKNGMKFLLQKIGIEPPATLEYQAQALSGYLKDNGATNFLRMIGTKSGPMPALKAKAEPEPESATKARATRAVKKEIEAQKEIEAAAEAVPQFDERGRYVGPERRTGAERRSGIDRRGEVATIRSNKRYGGDRRKKIRRLCDRLEANRLGLDARTFPPPPEKRNS